MILYIILSDSKSPQVSRTLLSIVVDLSNAVVWIVSTHPLISKSSSHFINPLATVPRTPIIIGINVTFMFHSVFNSLASSRYLSFFSLSFNFTLWSSEAAKFTILQVLFFWLIIIRSGRLADIRWCVCMLKSHRSLCVSLSKTDAGLCIYHLFVWVNLNFLHNSKWITLPTQSYLVLYSFCTNLQHSFIMWLIVSSLSALLLLLLLLLFLESFSHQRWLMVFHVSLIDRKSLQVSRTLLSILPDLNNDVVQMVSARPLISNSSSSFTKPLEIVLSSPITIGIIVTFVFHCFLSSLPRFKRLSIISFSLIFNLRPAGTAISTTEQVLFFC